MSDIQSGQYNDNQCTLQYTCLSLQQLTGCEPGQWFLRSHRLISDCACGGHLCVHDALS